MAILHGRVEVQRLRHLTKSDFDGIVCDRILREAGLNIETTKFVHAADVVNGKVPILGTDVMTCLPYDARCAMSFDYHVSYDTVASGKCVFDGDSPSSTRLLYNYYKDIIHIDEEIVQAVDDHCQGRVVNPEDPQGWELLGLLMDSRTGLGRWRDFSISNYMFMQKLMSMIGDKDIRTILADKDVQERVALLHKQRNMYINQLKRCTRVRDDVALIDFRNEELLYCGNRFIAYTLFPGVKYIMRITWGLRHSNIVVMLSSFHKENAVPKLCHKYGGFSNKFSGSFQISVDKSELAIRDIRNLLSN